MKTKIFYGNQFVEKFNCDGKKYTKWQRRKLDVTRWIKAKLLLSAKICVVAWMVVGGMEFGKNTTSNKIVYADREVVKEVEVQAPVMKRIAKCESSDMQFKNGQVVINVNTNGTYDQGRYQINSIWNKKANELGYNLANERDNEAFAMWLYKNYGTEPWSSSKVNCWNK